MPAVDLEAAAAEAISLAGKGMKLRAAAAEVAQQHGIRKNDVYELAVKTRRPPRP
jgi:16S rRNA C1402 (ribose-2'-O) methylase RsmI